MTRHAEVDVLIIGAGAAGLSLALRLADQARIAVLAKGRLTEGASLYAQGGVAAVLNNESDSFADHIRDTERAGAGLCHPDTVDFVVRRGPGAIRWLIDNGVAFSCQVDDEGHTAYHLTREGGHSHRRVIHAADATGKAIETTLEQKVRSHKNIELHENHIAIDLVTTAKSGNSALQSRCIGAYVLDKHTMKVRAFRARHVVLAAGGAAKVYLYTSNPDTSTGDGIAMAWRAGCRVANMEFIQFHPTCLYHPRAKSFLITEAVRGEGGHLRLPNGHRFMKDHDDRGELAPRDIVARAIDFEMKRHGLDHVDLDISQRPAEFIKEHFPTIHARCLEFGFDMTTGALPVVPAAHYTCGGILTDLHARTDIEGLYAIGECAFTGLHGANRLASNSLLECLVFAEAAAEDIAPRLNNAPEALPDVPAWDESRVSDPDEQVVVSHNWDELRRFMWDYVGIVRSSKRLRRAQRRIDLLKDEIREYYSNFKVTNDLIELRNLVLVAELIVRCALARSESRGLHYTIDFPQADEAHGPRDTVLSPASSDEVEVSQPPVTVAA